MKQSPNDTFDMLLDNFEQGIRPESIQILIYLCSICYNQIVSRRFTETWGLAP